jgi:type III secretion system YscQ/HrcQ family protein
VFTVKARQLWTKQGDIRVYAADPEAMSWQVFQDTSTAGRTSFEIRIHPIGAALCLEVSRAFLMEFADRILRPLEIDSPQPVFGATDSALFEFLMLCLMERANRDLAFPFQFETRPAGSRPDLRRGDKGVSMACSVNLLAATGALRVFIPYASLEAMRGAAPAVAAGSASLPITWKFPVSAGSVELSAREMAGLERNDVLIVERGLQLLLPNRFDRGWRAFTDSPISGPDDLSNFSRMRIEKYFEREPVNTEDPEAVNPPESSRTPDLGRLPVHVHVIVAEKELALDEVAGLTKGSILELDCEKTGVVVLAVNGRALGQGQLVDVGGRLGVRILSWRGA